MSALIRAKPDPNHHKGLLAYDDVTGEPFAVQGDAATGAINITGSITASSDGAIVDGVSSSIKATVKDLTNSNPLTTQIVDANGDAITSFGGGTQYTEGDTDASITGTAIMWEDTSDTLRAVSSAKPLPVVQTGTPGLPTGAATAARQDTGNTSLASIDTKLPAQGQALAAASVPVVLTAAQLTTITPPAAITGFATSALQTQPGVDIGDVTINNASGAAAVNIQDGGNSLTVDYATTGSGTATGALRVELPTNGTGIIATVGAVTAITNALPAGTNAIGKLAANSGVIIGDVNVTTLPVAFNTGTRSATTQRVTVATDDLIPANISQIGGNSISTGVGATGTGVIRTVEANGAGRTLSSAGGSASSSGNNTLVAAGTNKLKVYAFTLSTTSTTSVTCIFQSGASGTELWRVVLQAPTSVSTGANLVVNPPSYIFATASATLLNLNLSGAQTVHWSASYFDEA